MKEKNKRVVIILGILMVFGLVPSIYAIRNKVYKEEKINVENLNNKKQELNIIAAYIKQEDGTYKASNEIPSSGYTINEEKSVCSNGAKASWKENKLVISNLTKNGTNCYLYFDESKASDTILGDITPNPGSDSFTGVETTDKGIFTGTDDDGTTYYYRGAVTNNYLRFANKWWRIIRINGDGTIRIIYDGTAYHANGTSTTDSLTESYVVFNSGGRHNAYVGFMYGSTTASTYEEIHKNTNKSTVMKKLETWYENNLASFAIYIDNNAGFCGDRSLFSGTGIGGPYNNTLYGPYGRLNRAKTPSLACVDNDIYTVKEATKGNKAVIYPIGLITADEVSMAGGGDGLKNNSYYLYNGQSYWTISPVSFNSTNGVVYILYTTLGYLTGREVQSGADAAGNNIGLRPVINLRADVQITGSGTGEDPFVVVGAE